jgi:hypothetical protein
VQSREPRWSILWGFADLDIARLKGPGERARARQHVVRMVGGINIEKLSKLLLLVEYGLGFVNGVRIAR